MSPRKGRIYDPDPLWKLERQIDSAQQHLLKALQIVRKAIAEQEKGRTNKAGSLEEVRRT